MSMMDLCFERHLAIPAERKTIGRVAGECGQRVERLMLVVARN